MNRLVQFTFLSVGFALISSACDEDVRLGRAIPTASPPSIVGPPDSGFVYDASEPNPCEGKVCGDVCTRPGTGIQTETFCNRDGQCVDGMPVSCDGG